MMNHTVTFPEITAEAIASYRQNGFIRVRGLIPADEVAAYREAVVRVAQGTGVSAGDNQTFKQVVNAWRLDETVRRLTLHPNIGRVAAQLVGAPLRLWHDHILIKAPQNKAPTFFHQDQQYWPHEKGAANTSCWIALTDVPERRGCMSFIPGSNHRQDLQAQNLMDATSLFSQWPELEFEEKVTLPLRAGDCTFHDGRCAHMANDNATNEPRVALSVIMMGRDTRYRQWAHVVTDPLKPSVGQVLEGEMFPDLGG